MNPRPGVDDLILLNASGECTETTHGTLTVKNRRSLVDTTVVFRMPARRRPGRSAGRGEAGRESPATEPDIAKAIAVVSSAHGWRTAQVPGPR